MTADPGEPDDFDDLDDEDEDEDEEEDEDFELPVPHPDFVRAFPSPLYDDQDDEFAPFGSDEGWDAMAEIVEDFAPLDDDVTLRGLSEDVLELEDDEFDETGLDETADTDPAVIGVAFTILRLRGDLDDEGIDWLLDAIDRQRRRFGGNPTLDTIAADVEAFASQ